MQNPASRFKEIIDIIGPQITGGEIPADAVITLAQIEEKFSCSRTVAREAQRHLESCGLVIPKRHHGLLVQPRSQWNVLDPDVIRWRLAGSESDRQMRSLNELRQAIEPKAAHLAAQYASREERESLLTLADDLTQLGATTSGEEFLKVDIAFHTAILKASGNEMFYSLSSVIDTVLSWRTHAALMPPHPEPHAMQLHREVAQAIAQAQPARASQAMVAIVTEVQEAFDSHLPHVLRTPQGKTEQ